MSQRKVFEGKEDEKTESKLYFRIARGHEEPARNNGRFGRTCSKLAQ